MLEWSVLWVMTLQTGRSMFKVLENELPKTVAGANGLAWLAASMPCSHVVGPRRNCPTNQSTSNCAPSTRKA